MQCVLILLTTFLSIACWDLPITGLNGTRRPKRIGQGDIVRSKSVGYSAIKFFVWLGTPRTCDVTPYWPKIFLPFPILAWEWLGPGPRCWPDPVAEYCGGTLITPRIVATACHCVAVPVGPTLDPVEDGGFPFRYFAQYLLKNHWESRLEAFITGKLKVQNFGFNDMILSDMYFIHPKCSLMIKTPHFPTYDYGFIYLAKSADDELAYVDAAYAPAFIQSDLESHYEYVLASEAVCMVFGFGYYADVEHEYQKASPEMRHAWVWVMNNHMCYLYATKYQNLEARYEHEHAISFICSRPYGAMTGWTLPGDSGSPVTCNNKYFAVHSSAIRIALDNYVGGEYGFRFDWHMHHEPTAVAPFMFASDHRFSFEMSMRELHDADVQYRENYELWTSTPQTFNWYDDDQHELIKKGNFSPKSHSTEPISARPFSIVVAAILARCAVNRNLQF